MVVATTRAARRRPRSRHVHGLDEERVVPVEDAPRLVGPDRPVGVPVVGDAERGPVSSDLRGQAPGMERSAVPVDVPAVGGVVEEDDVEAEVAEDAGRDDRARAVRAVQDDAESGRPQGGGKQAFEESRVFVEESGLGEDLGPFGPAGFRPAEDGRFEAVLPVLPDLGPGRGEDLDAVVVIGVMGSREDDPGRERVLSGQIGDGRRRDDPGRDGLAAPFPEAADERLLHPGPGFAGVPADDDPRLEAFFAEQGSQGPAQGADRRRVEGESRPRRPGSRPSRRASSWVRLGDPFRLAARLSSSSVMLDPDAGQRGREPEVGPRQDDIGLQGRRLGEPGDVDRARRDPVPRSDLALRALDRDAGGDDLDLGNVESVA